MDGPIWKDGVPANLNAAARDAYEWLVLIRSQHDRGAWPFVAPDNRAKLEGCIAHLSAQICATPPTKEPT